MLLGSDLAAALGTSASRATTPTRTQTPLIGGDRPSPASARRRLLHPSMSRQWSPLLFAPNILRPNECQHFHYDSVELGPIKVQFVEMEEKQLEEGERTAKSGSEVKFTFAIESNGKIWKIVRTSDEMVEFDRQLHRCVFDRRHSQLQELDAKNSRLRGVICCYADRLSLLTGSLMRCYPVLTFFELDNRGNYFLPVERSLPNVPAVACAVVISPFVASQADQLRLRVGDIVSVVEIETKCDEKWMRGKLTVPSKDSEETPNDNRRFGVFPAHCVRLFSDRLSLGEQLWMASNSAASTTAHSLVRRSLPSFSPRHRRNGGSSMFSYALIRSYIGRLSKTVSSSSSSHSNPTLFQPKSCSPSSSSVFGVDLIELMAKSQNRHKEKTKVADVVEQCIRVVESRGMETGIYRQCGVQSNVHRLRRMFSSGTFAELESPSVSELLTCDIHSVGSLLKHFFRQLPNPLVPFQCHQKLTDVFGSPTSISGREVISKVSQIVKEFPPEHFHNAKRLFTHLQAVGRHPRTQTNARNLAIIWTPNLIRFPPQSPIATNGQCPHHQQLASLNLHTDICTILIAFADQIFADPSSGGSIGIVSRSSSMGSIEVENNRRKQSNEKGTRSSSTRTGTLVMNGGGGIGQRIARKTSLKELTKNGGETEDEEVVQQQQQIGAVHSVIERPKRLSAKEQKQCAKSGEEMTATTTANRRGKRNKSVDQCVHSPPLGQRLLSPFGKSFDGMGLSVFRRVRSMRHNVRRKFFKESAPKLSKSCHQLDDQSLQQFSPSSSVFIGENCAATGQKETTVNANGSTGRPCSPSPLLAIPFADDACSSTRISSTTSPALSVSFTSCDALSAKGGTARTEERRVNFSRKERSNSSSDGEQRQSKKMEQYSDDDNRRDSAESIRLDISRYDNVHSIITNSAR